jgi:hypothetical protein
MNSANETGGCLKPCCFKTESLSFMKSFFPLYRQEGVVRDISFASGWPKNQIFLTSSCHVQNNYALYGDQQVWKAPP